MGEQKRRADFEKLKPEDRLGDAPIEAEHHPTLVAMGMALNEILNGAASAGERNVGFVLMVFPFDGFDGRCNYISNGASRADVVTLMKEMIARFEGQPEMSGTA